MYVMSLSLTWLCPDTSTTCVIPNRLRIVSLVAEVRSPRKRPGTISLMCVSTNSDAAEKRARHEAHRPSWISPSATSEPQPLHPARPPNIVVVFKETEGCCVECEAPM